MNFTSILFDNFEIMSTIIFVSAFFISKYLTNKTIIIAHNNKLYAQTNHRSSHVIPTPSIGGIPIYITLLFFSLIFLGSGFGYSLAFTVASSFIIFVIGIKDDLVGASAKTKLIIQILAASLYVLNPEFVIGTLNNFLGIIQINPNWSYLLGLFYIVAITNAYNLIDGVNGLAGSIAIISFFVFDVYFYSVGDYIFSLFCSILLGGLVNFLFFNLKLNGNAKIFLGDSGSLVIGFFLAAFSLHIIEIQPITPFIEFFPINAVLFIFTVLIIPVADTVRIIIVRLINGKDPWEADKNHIHHVLLDTGLSHFQVTVILSTIQIFFVFNFFLLNEFGQFVVHIYVLLAYLSIFAIIGIISKGGIFQH